MTSAHRARGAARAAIIAWSAISLAAFGGPLLAGNAAAQTLAADSVGEVSVFGFVAWYDFVLLAPDCIQTRILLSSVVQSSFDYGCGTTGDRAFDGLFAPLDAGRYTLEIESTSTTQLLYTRSWTVPAITMTASVTPTTASAGDSVVVSVVFGLVPGGPDAYTTRGRLTVDAGGVFAQDITVTLFSARDLDFWTGQPTSAYETFTAALPVSFGTVGSQSVGIEYQDAAHAFVETRTVSVTDPTSDEVRRLRSEFAGGTGALLLALALGLVGIGVGTLGILTARRALRALAPPPQPPSPPVAAYFPPAAGPPVGPPPGPGTGSSPPGEPTPPREPPPPSA